MMVDNDIIINDNINYSNDDEIIILLINKIVRILKELLPVLKMRVESQP